MNVTRIQKSKYQFKNMNQMKLQFFPLNYAALLSESWNQDSTTMTFVACDYIMRSVSTVSQKKHPIFGLL